MATNRGASNVFLPRKELIRYTGPALDGGDELQTEGNVQTNDFDPIFGHTTVNGIVNVEGGGATVVIEDSIDGQAADNNQTVSVAAGSPQTFERDVYGDFVRVTLTANSAQTTTRSLIYASTRT